MRHSPYLAIFTHRRMAAITLLGFASGLPLALTGGTLQAWLTVSGISLSTIGLFALVGQPYTWKFLWAPFLDRFSLPFLGRRRGWLLVLQGLLALSLVGMAFSSPNQHLFLLGCLALAVAFFSASQDIAFDAYRTEVLKPEERGAGAAVSVLGYRVAMLVSGGLALVLAEHWLGWQGMYCAMAGCMAISMLFTRFAPEPTENPTAKIPTSLKQAFIDPLKAFFSSPQAGAFLALIIFYKLGDAFAGSLTTAFFIRGVHFSATDVGLVNKTFGLVATLVGVLIGGAWLARLGLFKALLIFGLLQAASNLVFFALAMVGHHYPLMVAAVVIENLCGGLGTAAFVALLMGLCDQRFTATQFALLSALSAVGRVYVGPLSGWLVEQVGWSLFFLGTLPAAFPGLGLVWFLRDSLKQLD